jgi:DNA-binding MarR family transcriptional regulator
LLLIEELISMIKRIDFKRVSVYAKPEESPGFLLWCVSMQWRRSIEDVLKPIGLTHPQFVVLATIGWLTRKGAIVSQAEIGRMVELDPNTISQIVRGLEVKNLIERTRSIDERGKNPTLTTKGSEILAQALPAVEQADAAFFDPLHVEESCELLKIFQKLVQLK